MVSGISQNNGMGDRSVVMCVVTPSMRLEGTAARPIQRRRRQAVISSEAERMETGSTPGDPTTGLGCGLPLLMAVLRAAAVATGAGAGGADVIPVLGGPLSWTGGGTGW